MQPTSPPKINFIYPALQNRSHRKDKYDIKTGEKYKLNAGDTISGSKIKTSQKLV